MAGVQTGNITGIDWTGYNGPGMNSTNNNTAPAEGNPASAAAATVFGPLGGITGQNTVQVPYTAFGGKIPNKKFNSIDSYLGGSK
jgi:hypothetical protein